MRVCVCVYVCVCIHVYVYVYIYVYIYTYIYVSKPYILHLSYIALVKEQAKISTHL